MSLKLKIDPKKLNWQGLTYIDLHKNKLLKDRKIIFKSVIFALARQIPKIWANDYYFGMLKGKGNFLIPNNDIYIHAYLWHFIVGYYEEYYSRKWGVEASINVEKYIKSVMKVIFKIFNSKQNVNDFYEQSKEFNFNEAKNKSDFDDHTNGSGDATTDVWSFIEDPGYPVRVETDNKLKPKDKFSISALKVYISKKYDPVDAEKQSKKFVVKVDRIFPEFKKKMSKKMKKTLKEIKKKKNH